MGENRSYANEYLTAMNSVSALQYLTNPYILNAALKNLNMNPASQDRDDLIDMVANPKSNERQLRDFSQYLYNVQTPFKRLAHYYADILSFDLSIYPVNATKKDMKSDAFKSEYDKKWKWLSKFDYKKEFKKITLGMMLEDAKFMYLRDEDTTKYTFQEMPSDYCIIDAKFPYGWLYSFDLNYFSVQGVDINSFAPEFKDYYNNYMKLLNDKNQYIPSIRPELRDGRWAYYQQLKPKNAWVFKFHEIFAGLVPPLLGLFVDANEIDTYKKLQSTKTSLDIFNLLIGLIPVNKNNKAGSKGDDIAISAEIAGQFNALINNQLPDGIKFSTVPFDDVKQFDFSKGVQDKDDIVGKALENFYSSSGSDQSLFNADKPNASTMKASTEVDAAFAKAIYGSFESFLDYQLNKKYDKFRFKTKLSGTIFDGQERMDNAVKLAEYGIITPELPSAMHMTEKEFRDGIALMDSLGYPDMFKPVQTAHTMSSNEAKDAGREELKVEDKTEKGEEASDNDTNTR